MQAFNKKLKAWVMYDKKKDGKTRILNVKQNKPTQRFSGVPTKK